MTKDVQSSCIFYQHLVVKSTLIFFLNNSTLIDSAKSPICCFPCHLMIEGSICDDLPNMWRETNPIE